jgi:hypothetical protein
VTGPGLSLPQLPGRPLLPNHIARKVSNHSSLVFVLCCLGSALDWGRGEKTRKGFASRRETNAENTNSNRFEIKSVNGIKCFCCGNLCQPNWNPKCMGMCVHVHVCAVRWESQALPGHHTRLSPHEITSGIICEAILLSCLVSRCPGWCPGMAPSMTRLVSRPVPVVDSSYKP